MTNLNRLIKKVLLFLFPFRDLAGITIKSTPLRFGEIFAGLSGLAMLIKSKTKIRSSEAFILLVLIINFANALFGVVVFNESVDFPFAIKYLIRNVVYIVFIAGFLKTRISFEQKDIFNLMKLLSIIIIILFLVCETTGFHVLFFKVKGWNTLLENGQYVSVGPLNLPRFMGPTTEAGYMAPLLVMPLFYFLNLYINNGEVNIKRRQCMLYVILLLVISVFTFSSAVYLFVVITFLFVTFSKLESRKSKKIILLAFVAVLLCVFVVISFPSLREIVQRDYVNKIITYFSKEKATNWSATDRKQHFDNAVKLYKEGDLFQKIFGHGTGAYYLYAQNSVGLLVTNVNEAYNLFLSSLTDRGIIGFLCLVSIPLFLLRFRVKSIESETIFCGIIFQYIHWMLTGNFWLYYFWYEIVLLIGVFRYGKNHAYNSK